MAKAYRLTKDQWLALPDKVKAKFPGCGANWYHSNYHLCSCIEAIQNDIALKPTVYNSYDAWTRTHSFDARAKRLAWKRAALSIRDEESLRVCDLIP